jgi:hypothetical protein
LAFGVRGSVLKWRGGDDEEEGSFKVLKPSEGSVERFRKIIFGRSVTFRRLLRACAEQGLGGDSTLDLSIPLALAAAFGHTLKASRRRMALPIFLTIGRFDKM